MTGAVDRRQPSYTVGFDELLESVMDFYRHNDSVNKGYQLVKYLRRY